MKRPQETQYVRELRSFCMVGWPLAPTTDPTINSSVYRFASFALVTGLSPFKTMQNFAPQLTKRVLRRNVKQNIFPKNRNSSTFPVFYVNGKVPCSLSLSSSLLSISLYTLSSRASLLKDMRTSCLSGDLRMRVRYGVWPILVPSRYLWVRLDCFQERAAWIEWRASPSIQSSLPLQSGKTYCVSAHP